MFTQVLMHMALPNPYSSLFCSAPAKWSKPVRKLKVRTEKSRWTSKICSDFSHGKGKPNPNRQRHACRKCMLEYIAERVSDGTNPTQIVRRVTHEFRNYFCAFCLDAHKHEFATTHPKKFVSIKNKCRLHAKMNAEKKCPCGMLWQYCTKCDDYRAGTLVRSRRSELCPPLPVKKTPDADEHIASMDRMKIHNLLA